MAETAEHGRQSFSGVILTFRRWWRQAVVNTVDQAEVIEKRREEAQITPRYLFMLAMSAGIAMLGLLLSSPAVVIGAMLIAPLMGPIISSGFALAIGDYGWLKGSVKAIAVGTVVAVALCAFLVFLSPLQVVTPEIAARTQPNLFDLGVAVFSALAGAYSMIRGREGTIVGVAIATALMPPLAVVGFGLATWNWTVFSGALLLFVTNLMTIALVATVMARLYGFSTRLSERQTQFQTAAIVIVFVALAIPLFLSLRNIVWESNAARQIRQTILADFDGETRLSQIEYDLKSDPITITATVLTPETINNAQSDRQEALSKLLGGPVTLTLTQFRVDTAAQAEAAELASANAQQEAKLAERAQQLAGDLALVAGGEEKDVTVDRQNRRAVVRAKALPGAGTGTYRELERRIAALAPDWTIEIQPPLVALPEIPFENGQPTVEGLQAIADITWSAKRASVPVALRGGTPATREVAAGLLEAEGITPSLAQGGPVMQAIWAPGTGG